MTPSFPAAKWSVVAVVGLCAVQAVLLARTAWDRSDTIDEPHYLAVSIPQWLRLDLATNWEAPALPRWGSRGRHPRWSRATPEARRRVLGVPGHRRLLSRGASTLFRLVYPVTGVRDYTCGYRAYRAGLLRQAFARWGNDFVSESGFSCMVDILLKLDRPGALITEAPLILRYDRKPGKSKMDVRRTVLQTLKHLGRHRFGRVR